jgi:hypothetical protein
MSGISYQRCATPRRADSSSSHKGCHLFPILRAVLALQKPYSTAMRRRTRPFPSRANTLPKWGRRKKHHAPFSPHCKSAGKAAVAVARDQVDELGAALAPFPHDLAAVERLQLDTLGDADDGCAGLRG